jgi:hypothetical protein
LIKNLDYFGEFYFWDNFLSKKHPILIKFERKKFFPEYLLEIIIELKKTKSKISLLEVGSGPLSNLVWGVDQNLFQIIAIDPLADIYDKLMKKYALNYPIKPIKGNGEKLLKLFKTKKFDIVYSRNALDHTRSPKICNITCIPY